MASNGSDEPPPPVGAATDSALDEVLSAAGFVPTAAGKQRWRQRLSTPIPGEALEEGRRMLGEARAHHASVPTRELLVWENAEWRASLFRGLADAAEGRTRPLDLSDLDD